MPRKRPTPASSLPLEASSAATRRARVAGRLRGKSGTKAQARIAELEARLAGLRADLANHNSRLEEALAHLQQTQVQLVHSEKMSSLGQLVAGVSHEISNPITFIYSGLTLLEANIVSLKQLTQAYEQALSPATRDELRRRHQVDRLFAELDFTAQSFREGTVRVRDIVRGLRAFSRLDTYEYRDVNLKGVLETTCKIVQVLHNDYLRVQLTCDPMPGISGSEGHLSQLFMNLLLNACHAIEERGEIRVWGHTEQDQAVVEISDTGCGIPADLLPRIFEPFFTTKPVGTGTGLGLSICHGIVQKHNGRISVESTSGQGTCFRVSFPRAGSPVGLPLTGP